MRLFSQLRHLFPAVLLAAAPAITEAFDDTAVARFEYPGWFKTTFFDLRDDLAGARADGKRGILLFFSTTGCSYCKQMLDGSFREPRFAERLREHYDVIGLEIFSDSEITDWSGDTRTLSAFAEKQGVQFSPTLLFLDLDGRRLLRLVGYYDTGFLDTALDYLDSGEAPETALPDWLGLTAAAEGPAGQQASPLDDGLFASPPHQLDRRQFRAQRPLLVMFYGNGCTPCTAFHRQVLGDPSTRTQLQAFDVVGLDARDHAARLVAPDGRVTTAAAWHRDLGFSRLPALAVFDEHGRRLIATDAQLQRGRFAKLLGYVRGRAYERGWSFQRYARNESIRRIHQRQTAEIEP